MEEVARAAAVNRRRAVAPPTSPPSSKSSSSTAAPEQNSLRHGRLGGVVAGAQRHRRDSSRTQILWPGPT